MRKVQGLFVAKGNKVEAGQGVVALDDSGLRAEGLSLAASLASLRAEAAHRTAAIAAARAKDFKPPRCRLAARCARKYSRARAAGPCRGSCLIAVLNREPCRTAAAKAGRAHAVLANTIASREELLKIEDDRVQLRSYLGNAHANADGEEIPISNGMAVTVEIKTGERRIIDYVFSPFVEVASTAMKER